MKFRVDIIFLTPGCLIIQFAKWRQQHKNWLIATHFCLEYDTGSIRTYIIAITALKSYSVCKSFNPCLVQDQVFRLNLVKTHVCCISAILRDNARFSQFRL